MVDINQLTNEEIRDQLVTHGCDPGPVVGSTRNVYANKLRRLLEGESDSDVAVTPERAVSDVALTDSLKSSPKRGDVTHSQKKSRSPRRAAHSSIQDTSDVSKFQIMSSNSKISRTSSKTTNVSSAHSLVISDSKQSSLKPHVVQPFVSISPKPHVDLELETRTEISTVPESHRSPSRSSVTSELASLDVISSSSKAPKPYSFETIPEIYRTTPTTRFTSLRDNWENGKVGDGSDDDLRGEESSRILSPSWREDHTYSARYDSKLRSVAQHCVDGNSTVHFRQASHYGSVAFENSYDGHGNRRNGLMDKEKASRSYGKIGLFLLFIITTVIFMFFVVQNYIDLEHSEGNKEEF